MPPLPCCARLPPRPDSPTALRLHGPGTEALDTGTQAFCTWTLSKDPGLHRCCLGELEAKVLFCFGFFC